MGQYRIIVLIVCVTMVTAWSPPVNPPEVEVPERPPVDPNFNDITIIRGERASRDMLDPCLQPKTKGPCEESLPRYYFNVKTSMCEKFEYSGCYGNENNFQSLQDCLLLCLRGNHGGGEMTPPPGVYLNKLFP